MRPAKKYAKKKIDGIERSSGRRLNKEEVPLETPLVQSSSKFMQIRVKSIDFLEERATAIYFYDMTDHVQSMRLQSEVL